MNILYWMPREIWACVLWFCIWYILTKIGTHWGVLLSSIASLVFFSGFLFLVPLSLSLYLCVMEWEHAKHALYFVSGVCFVWIRKYTDQYNKMRKKKCSMFIEKANACKHGFSFYYRVYVVISLLRLRLGWLCAINVSERVAVWMWYFPFQWVNWIRRHTKNHVYTCSRANNQINIKFKWKRQILCANTICKSENARNGCLRSIERESKTYEEKSDISAHAKNNEQRRNNKIVNS